MAVRKSGEGLLYKRTTVPKINEVDPTDNPSFGDMWIDISVNPPVVKVLDNLLNPVAITTALTPPVVITGTNPATIPLTIIPATAQSTSVFVIQKVPGGGAANDILTVSKDGAVTIGATGSVTALQVNSSGIGITINQNATGQPALNVAFANPNTVVSFANTAWKVNDDLLSDRAGFILARGATPPTIQLRILRYAGFGTAFANGYLSFFAQDGTTAIFGVNADGGVNITPSATSTVPIFINSPTGQVGNLITAQVNSVEVMSVTPTATLTLTGVGSGGGVFITVTNSSALAFSINAQTGFTGNFSNYLLNSVSRYLVDFNGNLSFGNTAVAPTVGAGQIGLGTTTATSANAGANGAVPAQVVGYWIVNIGGTSRKIPFFAT